MVGEEDTLGPESPRAADTPPQSPLPVSDTVASERALRPPARARLDEGLEPVRIGRYAVLGRIGAGGMGVVYAAYDTDLDRKIAIKLLLPGAGDSGPRTARLVREAKALARVSDPAIVQVYEVAQQDDRVFIAMEFVDGQTMGDWVRSAQRPWREIVGKYVEAGRGLAAAHSVGLVHRDFKPDNVLVTVGGRAAGRVRVLDFGLAGRIVDEPLEVPREASVRDDQLTATGAILGTPAYMAPEQHRGKRADERSDQFSFCVSLWEALHGARPFAGATLPALVNAVLEGAPQPAEPMRGLPLAVRRLLLRGLERDPSARHPSMDVLIAQLERLAGGGTKRILATIAGVGGAAMVAGGVIWVQREQSHEERASALVGEVADERGRADEAELALRAREDAVTIAEVELMLDRDPTRAVAMLARLRADSPEWASGVARMLAADAMLRTVASSATPLPPTGRPRRLSPRGLWSSHQQSVTRVHFLHELATGRTVTIDPGGELGTDDFAFDAKERHVLTARGNRLVLWDLDDGSAKELARLEHEAKVHWLAPDATSAVVIEGGSTPNAVVVAADGAVKRHPLGKIGWNPVILADGSAVVVGDGEASMRLHDLRSGAVRELGAAIAGPHSSPDGRWAAALAKDGVALWSLVDDRRFVLQTEEGLSGDRLAFDSASTTLAMASTRGPIVCWDLESRESRVLSSAMRASTDLQVDGGRVIAVMRDDSVGIWRISTNEHSRLRVDGGVHAARLLDGGATVVTVGAEHWARRWTPAPDTLVVTSRDHLPRDVAFAGDALLWDEKSGIGRLQDGHPGVLPLDEEPVEVAASTRGEIAVGTRTKVLVLDARGQERARVEEGGGVADLRFFADGERVAWRTKKGAHLWRPGDAAPSLVEGAWRWMAVAPDGERIAGLSIAEGSGRLIVIDPSTKAPLWTAPDPVAPARMEFSSDGRLLALGGLGSEIALFATDDGSRRSLVVPHDAYDHVVFSPDDRTIFAVGRSLVAIDVTSGAAMQVPIPIGTTMPGLRQLAVRSDGRAVAFPGWNGSVWQIGFEAPSDPESLRQWVDDATNLEVDGRPLPRRRRHEAE